MGGRRPDGHITGPRNTRMEEMSRRQRIMEASSEGGQGPEGAVAPWMDGWNGTTFGEIMPMFSTLSLLLLLRSNYSERHLLQQLLSTFFR